MDTDWLLPDRKIWVKLDEIFIPATVTDRNEKTKQVGYLKDGSKDKFLESFSNCYPRSASQEDYDDMCNMNILNEPEILTNLKGRYRLNKIYTKIGPTLIAINPYKVIDSLYGDEILMTLRESVKTNGVSDKLSPHVYLTAGAAFHNLKAEGRKQAIVISGESGAGKTENTKYCMKFLTSLSHVHNPHEKHRAIEDIILECNPILEAFGNSKTVRNSNSSRFGKFVKLFLGEDEHITGARVQNYLLEKSRVTSVAKKERSFHVFYYLINSHEREASGLLPNEKYEYLDASGCMTAEGIDDKSDFRILKSALEDVGFSKDNCLNLWTILASILLLGNLNFDNKDNLANENNHCRYSDPRLAQRICKSFGMKIQQLNGILLEQKLSVGKQVMVKKYDKNQCLTNRNTLAKALYGRIFDFLIQKINQKLWTNKKDDRSIGLLDIFGFQIFDKNSFQQLCINYTNQRLQKLYTKYVFENQIDELKKDGLSDKIKNLTPPDNRQIIELIEKRMGVSVFSLIDEKTALGSAKDEDLVAELRKLKNAKLYVEPEPNKTTFMILHTQNIVTYHVDGFKYKNQDSVTNEIETLLTGLFPITENQQFKGKTLVTKFDKQLRVLNDQLEASQLHFIRCIKPNQTKQKDNIDDRFTLQQIKYLGILETIQIRKSTYAFRSPFDVFNGSYKMLVSVDKAFSKLTPAEQTIFILKRLFPGIEKEKNAYLLGKERVYLREDIEKRLNELAFKSYEVKHNATIKIQNQFLRYKQRKSIIGGLKKYLNKSRKLRKVVVQRLKSVYLKYFKRMRDQAKLATKQLKDKKGIEDRKKAEKSKQLENETAEKSKQQEMEKAYDKLIEKGKRFGEVMTRISPTLVKYQRFLFFMKLKINANNALLYQSVVYDHSTVIPNYSPEKSKPKEPEMKSTELSQTYLLHQSVVIEDKNILVKGELRLPFYERNPEAIKKLRDVICHSSQDNEEESSEFNTVTTSKDAAFVISSSTVKGELGHRIVNFQYLDFFEQSLRKRKTLFGRKKDPLETLTAKDGPMSKSLILLSETEESKALEVFKLLLAAGDSHKTQKIYQPIERIIQLMQNTSQTLKNEVFTQILKQQHVKTQYAAIKMYQMMAIFLHIFRVQETFLIAALSLLLQRSQDPFTFQKSKEFINYLFPRLLRQVQQKEQSLVLYMPIQFQLASLMCKRQIPISVFFSIGNSLIVKVQSYEVLADIKERICEMIGVNHKRISKDMFGFFEVMSFENEELEEAPLDDNRNIWDLLTYWDRAKSKFEESKIRPPDFGLYIKVKYAYECTFDDEETIELYYCQSYFDLFIGRIKLPMPLLLECSAFMKAEDQNMDIDYLIPLWALQDSKSKQTYLEAVNVASKKFVNLTRHQLRFNFIKNCDTNPLCMSIPFPTECPTKLYMKPKRVFLVENDRIVEEIGIRRILRWGSDECTLMLTIKDQNSQRIVTIRTQYARIVSNYLSTCMKLIIAMKT